MTSVCITTNTLKPGGAERQRVHLANGLAAQGYKVECRVLQVSGELADQLHPSVGVTVLSGRTSEYVRPPNCDILLTGITRTEIAHALSARAWAAASRRKIAWIAASHHAFPCADSHVEVPYARETALALRWADVVVALTDAHAQYLRATTAAKRFEVIANGIPLEGGSRVDGVRTGRPRAVFLGRVTEQKGLGPFLTAWTRVSDRGLSLDIWGEGPLHTDLHQRFGHLRDVRWRGWADSTQARMSEADLLILPSLWEAQPMVILEAFSAGLPVAASAVGGVPELLGGGRFGDLVDPTEDAWAAYLDGLPAKIEPLQRKARGATEYVRNHHSVSGMIQQHDRLFRELIPVESGHEVG